MPRAVLLACVIALLLPAAAQAATPRGFFGVLVDGPAIKRSGTVSEAGAIARSGTRSVRIAAYWDDLEPTRGGVDLRTFDATVVSAARSGLVVLPVVHRTPNWARKNRFVSISPPGDPRDYARFLEALVARYGPSGSLWREQPGVPKRPIRRWQVWNEPDIGSFWGEPNWPEGYTALLRVAYGALHRADPGVTVVAAGLTNKSWLDLRLLYEAGAKGFFDEAAIHPFSRRVSNVLKIIRLARAEMNGRGDAAKPLALTEMSWSSGKGRSTLNYGWETSEAGQAEKIREVLPKLAAVRKEQRLSSIYWSTWLSKPLGGSDSFDYGGLRRVAGGKPRDKPALVAWKSVLARLTR